MSRKKDNFVPFPEYFTLTNGKEKRFIRKGASMMRSKQYIELSATAKVIFDYMALEAGREKHFIFPYSACEEQMSKNTFFRARNELIEAGFITVVENNANLRKPNVYSFSSKWKYKKLL